VPARSVQDYIETSLEPLGDAAGPLVRDWGAFVSRTDPYSVGSLYNLQPEPERYVPAPPIFPTVRIVPPQPVEDSATPGPEALPTIVVDPESGPTTTVFEDVPGGIYETSRAPTDWDAVYEQYVILNAPESNVGLFDAVDWGEITGTIVGGILDPFGYGAATQAAFSPPGAVAGAQAVPNLGAPVTSITGGATMTTGAACPPTGPKYGKICLATGVITPLRRRRRRRLLTSSDIKDLSALKSIVSGAALQGAVIQAVRR